MNASSEKAKRSIRTLKYLYDFTVPTCLFDELKE